MYLYDIIKYFEICDELDLQFGLHACSVYGTSILSNEWLFTSINVL